MEQENGFIPLRRGLDTHLSDIDGDALKLYLRLLIRAEWRGEHRGCYVGKLKDLAASFGWSTDKLSRNLKRLSGHYVVLEYRGTKHCTDSVIRVLRYDRDGGTNGSKGRKSADLSRNQVVPGAELTAVKSANPNGQVVPGAELTLRKCGVDSNQIAEHKEDRATEEVLRIKNKKEERKKPLLPSLTLLGKEPWKSVGLYSLPGEFAEFVEFVERNRPRKNERLRTWMNRVLAGWQIKSPHIQAPKAFTRVVLSKIESEGDVVVNPKTRHDVQCELRLKSLLRDLADGPDRVTATELLRKVKTQSLTSDDIRTWNEIYARMKAVEEV